MSSKSVRNVIIALIILAIGIKLIMVLFNGYLSNLGVSVSGIGDLVGAVDKYGTWAIYGIIIIIIVAIPVYLSKRSDEKKGKIVDGEKRQAVEQKNR